MAFEHIATEYKQSEYKQSEYTKSDVSFKEFMMHEYIYNLCEGSGGLLNVPKILNYDVDSHKMTMENIPFMCVADYYGDKATDITPGLFSRIRAVIQYLYDNHIIYPDITGYNFIEYDEKIWIIDFEHSDFQTNERNVFVEEFVHNEKYNKWNPWFA